MIYSTGKYAEGICDRCGQSFPYLELRPEDERPGTMVCNECDDRGFNIVNHPQNKPILWREDPQALEHARPDTDTALTTAEASWAPEDQPTG